VACIEHHSGSFGADSLGDFAFLDARLCDLRHAAGRAIREGWPGIRPDRLARLAEVDAGGDCWHHQIFIGGRMRHAVRYRGGMILDGTGPRVNPHPWWSCGRDRISS
jgi:hypothetical protein